VSAAVEEARQRLGDLDRGEDAVLKALSDAGAVSTRLDALDSRLADVEVDVESRRSRIQDTDLATTLSDLQANEAVYQSSLLVTARLSRISLANYL
jgi:flagellar hook-associated protein 3 FlgL